MTTEDKAAAPIPTVMDAVTTALPGIGPWAKLVLAVVGVDPDMSREALQERFAYGEQVQECGTQACELTGEEYYRYQWRNALDQWRWWHNQYVIATGDDRGRTAIEMGWATPRPGPT